MAPCQTIEEALEAIGEFYGPPAKFRLLVANNVLDPPGANMAIETDAILAQGWLPDGFEDMGDHRLFRYIEME